LTPHGQASPGGAQGCAQGGCQLPGSASSRDVRSGPGHCGAVDRSDQQGRFPGWA